MQKLITIFLLCFSCLSWSKSNIYVAQPPGGISDIVARTVAKHMGEVIVINMPGVLSQQAPRNAHLNKQPLFIETSTVIIDKMLHGVENVYDITANFTGAVILGYSPTVLIASPQISNLEQLKQLTNVNYAVSGAITQVSALELLDKLKLKGLAVPYKGGANAVRAVMSGEVKFHVGNLTGVYGLIGSGKVNVIQLDVSTRGSYGIAFPNTMSYGKWRQALIKVAKSPQFAQDLANLGFTVNPLYDSEYLRWYSRETNHYVKMLSKHSDSITR